MQNLYAQNNGNPGSAQGGGMMYGISAVWLIDALKGLQWSTSYGFILPLAAAGVACVSLLWVLSLRKRLAKYKLLASNQGERYRQFFSDCPDALLVVEEDGSIVSANPQACTLLQMEGPDLLAHTCMEFIDRVSRIEFGKKFQQCLMGKSMHCEAGIQIGNGPLTPVEVNGSLQRINQKNLVQLYIRDKRVQLETEEQVHSLYKQLEQATAEMEEKEKQFPERMQKAREELVANINHRIRTPLDGIMGMGQILSDSALSIDQHNHVNMILNSSHNLLKVVDSMSEDPESAWDNAEPNDGFADLRAICKTLNRNYDPIARQKGVEFRCDCQDNVPLQVVADSKQLTQVLSALLDNAFQFTMEGLVMLSVECRKKTAEEAELYFQVIDTGLGIDEDFQPTILELSSYGHGNAASSGMGWTACRRVVKQLGGTIGRTNTVGKGSTVYFGLTLPLELPKIEAEEQAPVADEITGSIEDVRVLVVDDNKVSQKVAVAMLEKGGARVTVASNGKEALAQIREKTLDVVLMDCHMPVMDGYKATESIRSMEEPQCSLPVIALTAHSLKHELQACRDSGMDDCLVKPIERQKLVDMVAKYATAGHVETAKLKAS